MDLTSIHGAVDLFLCHACNLIGGISKRFSIAYKGLGHGDKVQMSFSLIKEDVLFNIML